MPWISVCGAFRNSRQVCHTAGVLAVCKAKPGRLFHVLCRNLVFKQPCLACTQNSMPELQSCPDQMQVLSNLGFSGCIGMIAGITLKKVGQLLALLIGLTFCALQVRFLFDVAKTGCIHACKQGLELGQHMSVQAYNSPKICLHSALLTYQFAGLDVFGLHRSQMAKNP